MATNETQRALIDYIRVELLEDPDFELGITDQLLLDDIVDSLGVMRLVAFIEQEFNYKVPAGDLTIQNFRTIGVLSDYLGRSLGDEKRGTGHA